MTGSIFPLAALDAPTEARLLQPLYTREIIYRLLMREQGGRLRHLTISGGYPHRRGLKGRIGKKGGEKNNIALV